MVNFVLNNAPAINAVANTLCSDLQVSDIYQIPGLTSEYDNLILIIDP